ncbi:MAG: protein kinase [Deltaproteobacteria bacterium]
MEQTLVIRRRSTPRGTFGRYALLAPIGRGGMGEVWLAQREGAPGPCVLKRLTEALVDHEVAHKRFVREAHVAAFLDHPNVAKTLDAGFVDDAFYIAMEHVAGVDLADVIGALRERDTFMPLPIVMAIATMTLDALAYVHDATGPDGAPLSIVHRDLAPKNLMLTFDGDVKVIDFGVARASVGDFETRQQVLVGTVEYFSPEQAAGERVDRRTDLYALGVVLFEMLTLVPVIEELPVGEALAAITVRAAPSASALRPEIPAAIDEVLYGALAKAPADRFATAARFAAALRATGIPTVTRDEVAAWLGEHFQPEAAATHVADTSEATRAAVLPPPEAMPKPSRAPYVLLALALVSTAVLLLFALPSSTEGPPARAPEVRARAVPSASALPSARAVPSEQPPTEEAPAPKKPRPRRRRPVEPAPDLARTAEPSGAERLQTALAAKGLERGDLTHQHHVPGVRALRTAKSPAARERASAKVLSHVDEIDWSRWRLRRRVAEVQRRLEASKDASLDSELIDLRMQLAGDGALTPKTYGKICKKLDALER